jgi:hypothetical protein
MSVQRVVMRAHIRGRLRQCPPASRPCLVFGNGPSLYRDIRDRVDLVKGIDVFCVGRFAESDWFRILKPKYYVFADPMWWAPLPPASTLQLRNRLFGRLLEGTDWNMTLCIPFAARELYSRAFSESPHISLRCYNNVPLSGRDAVVHALYDHGLGMPPAQNVLVTSLFLALHFGYRTIGLFGADHSWHETVTLDCDNRVCVRDSHFYEQNVQLRPFSIDGSEDRIFRMDNLFHAFGEMFAGYWKVTTYAKRLHAQILNGSSTTYIDAFPRREAGDLLAALVATR